MTTIVVEDASRVSLDAEPSLMTPYVHPALKQGSAKVLETPVSEQTSLSVPVPSLHEDAAKAKRERTRYRIVLGTIFWTFCTLGLNDGSTGPLLPVYQSFYHVCIELFLVSRACPSNSM